jgi:hypothetical protein
MEERNTVVAGLTAKLLLKASEDIFVTTLTGS